MSSGEWLKQRNAVPDAAVQAALTSEVPGGAEVKDWFRRTETGEDVVRSVIAGAIPHLSPTPPVSAPADVVEALRQMENFASVPYSGFVNEISKQHLRQWIAALSRTPMPDAGVTEAMVDRAYDELCRCAEHLSSKEQRPALKSFVLPRILSAALSHPSNKEPTNG